MKRTIPSLAVSAVLILAAAAPGLAATIIVNSSADTTGNDGVCTLREAIIAANSNAVSGNMAGECAKGDPYPALDTITFAIPGSGVQTITPTSSLPDITEQVVIDGYSQSDSTPNTLPVGDNAVLRIQIDGTALGSNRLFNVLADHVTISGLLMNHVAGVALQFSGNNEIVSGNFLQTDASGNTFLGGAGASAQPMIIMVGGSNLIGGTDPGARNVIGGGGGTAAATIEMAGNGNAVQGNHIGVTADGSAALEPDTGINTIDLGAYGTSVNATIGGAATGAGNVIYGQNIGIEVAGASGTVIQGNFIGVDATGSHALGPALTGIFVYVSHDTTIGGASAGNVISGYYNAINIYGAAPGTIIQGNRIGTDASGTRAIENTNTGITIASPGYDSATSSTKSLIGGTDPGQGNTIAYSCGAGIFFSSQPTYTQWPILGNSIFSNHNLAISLDSSPNPLANDAGDTDAGSNNQQNYPTITSAPISAGQVSISGTLNSAAGTTFRVELFSGVGCNASGFGEGRHYLGFVDTTTNGGGNASFGPAAFAVPAGHGTFTATATDPDGNTSEFSQCFGTPDLLFHGDFENTCAGYD